MLQEQQVPVGLCLVWSRPEHPGRLVLSELQGLAPMVRELPVRLELVERHLVRRRPKLQERKVSVLV